MSEPEPTAASRFTGLGEALARAALIAAAVAVVLGLIAATIAWASGRGASATMAAAYYIVGSLLFLIGMFPSGGFSLMRGTVTRRRPIGSRLEAPFLLGVVLIGLGVIVDVTHPF